MQMRFPGFSLSPARLLMALAFACVLPASADPEPGAGPVDPGPEGACREAEGRLVTFQDFQGLRTTDAEVVTRELRNHPGERFTCAKWERERIRLEDLDIFSEVGLETAVRDSQVALTYRFRELPPYIPFVALAKTDQDGLSLGPALASLNFLGQGIRAEFITRFGGTTEAQASMAKHVEAMVGFMDRGAEVFDYGNSIRDEARKGGYGRAFEFPGFVPAYIRPLFEEGLGPFRWAALSGDPADIAATDRAIVELFPENDHLRRWITMAGERVAFEGLPARIAWLGYGERHRAGLKFNEMVASGELSAPIAIGRDHLDSGSVASPYRETEAMADGSDAIADWPLLNALVNTASGASWVSIHHGGGVGIGRSIHAGQVCIADGTELAAQKLARVLTNDPGMGVIRHVDAGYEHANNVAHERGVRIPMQEN